MSKAFWAIIIVILLVIVGMIVFRGESSDTSSTGSTDSSSTGSQTIDTNPDTAPESTALAQSADEVDTSEFSDNSLDDLG